MNAYGTLIASALAEFKIPPDLIARRGLPLHPEATDLVAAEIGENGRTHWLVPAAAAAWQIMRSAAKTEGITITIVSAFRTFDRQAEIIRRKLADGIALESILALSAPPGYSEHHTGRAIDVTTPGAAPLETEFETTAAFDWLTGNGPAFGFTMSYPRDNGRGFAYEPWHWCHRS
jgi:D-alanyl-D-alanine carboxypeptidase